ncbi:MAG: restriction endonuclease [Phycisphaerae bacterium]
MSVPGYQEFMLPLLQIASDGQEHSISEAIETLAMKMGISTEDQELLLPSGTQTLFYNRVSWAITYLTKGLLLEKSGRGRFKITQRGVDVLGKNPVRIDNNFLDQYAEYRDFRAKKNLKACETRNSANSLTFPTEDEVTPAEQLEAAYKELRNTLADDLQIRVHESTPKFFEYLVIRLLVALGYGGGQIDRAEVTGKSGDEGIDGIIREDRLGLDMVYVQAKKWDDSVGPGEIDKFVGSLMRKKATKGVFITSGTFTEGAHRAAKEAAVKVRLIDGDELAELMIDFNVGVAPSDTYIIKKLDTDFFEGMV